MSFPSLDQEGPSEREQIRGLLAENIHHLNERVAANRDDELSPEAERLQLSRLRTMSQLARQYRLLARDADVDEMESQVHLLREALRPEGDDR